MGRSRAVVLPRSCEILGLVTSGITTAPVNRGAPKAPIIPAQPKRALVGFEPPLNGLPTGCGTIIWRLTVWAFEPRRWRSDLFLGTIDLGRCPGWYGSGLWPVSLCARYPPRRPQVAALLALTRHVARSGNPRRVTPDVLTSWAGLGMRTVCDPQVPAPAGRRWLSPSAPWLS